MSSTTYLALATVQLEIIGKINSKFTFVYSKDFHVRALDPSNGEVQSPNSTIRVIGTNFLPVDHLLKCKLFFSPPIEVTGRYINNHTLECDLPPLPINP